MSSQPNREPNELAFRRVLLKISGEALMGEQNYGIDVDIARQVAKDKDRESLSRANKKRSLGGSPAL